MIKNVFYFHHLNVIGGVENMFYELGKKYKDWDIVVYYGSGDKNQIARLKQFVDVRKYETGQIIECEKVFFNYRAPIIKNVKAKEYYMMIHADYKAQGIEPPKVPNYVKYIGVSQAVCDSFTEISGKPCQLCYNPITIDPPKRVLKLVSATRLTKEKGYKRMCALAKALDDAGIPYTWYVYTNSKETIPSPNVKYMPPTLDINTQLAQADYVVQLSDSESYCYTMIEALLLHIPIIVTPWGCLKELGITEEYGFILPFDMKNIPVKEIYEKRFNFDYQPPKDRWDEILEPGDSQYQYDLKCKYKVRATSLYKERNCTDGELGFVPKPGYEWTVSKIRYDTLSGNNRNHLRYVTLVEKIPPEEEKPKSKYKVVNKMDK